MKKYSQLSAMSLLVVACLSFAGCMIGPNDGDRVSDRDDRVLFNCVSNVPGEEVQIQAKNATSGAWQTIDSFHVGTSAAHWNGSSWYFGMKTVSIPRECWKLHLLGSVDRYYFTSEVRLLTENGASMISFKRGFEAWFYERVIAESPVSHEATQEEFNSWMSGKSSATLRTNVQSD